MKWIVCLVLMLVSLISTDAQITIEEPAEMQRVKSDYARLYPMDELVQGWSILVALNRDRRKIDEILRDFKYRYPAYGRDLSWKFENPYYKIVFGAFEEQKDALPLLEAIRKKYPSAFVVQNNFIRSEILAFQRLIRL